MTGRVAGDSAVDLSLTVMHFKDKYNEKYKEAIDAAGGPKNVTTEDVLRIREELMGPYL